MMSGFFRSSVLILGVARCFDYWWAVPINSQTHRGTPMARCACPINYKRLLPFLSRPRVMTNPISQFSSVVQLHEASHKNMAQASDITFLGTINYKRFLPFLSRPRVMTNPISSVQLFNSTRLPTKKHGSIF